MPTNTSSRTRELRLTLLARRMTDAETLFFPVVVVVDEDEPALFSATIAGMERQVIASGISEDDAAHDAIETFMDIIDLAIQRKLPLTKVVKQASPFKRLAVPFSGANKVFESFERMIEAKTESALTRTDWTQVSATDEFIPLTAY